MDDEFGLHYILMDLDWKSFKQQFRITLIRYSTDFGLKNTWATNLDYNYYILVDLDLKVLRLWIWILNVIYFTGSGLGDTWTVI